MRDKRELVLESHKVQHCNMTIITMMTTWCVRVCGLNSLVVYFNVRTRDFGEGKVTAGSEIWTENIHSLESTRRKEKKEKRSMHRIWVVTWHYHHLRKNKVRFQKNSSMFLHWPTKNFIAHKILYSEGDDCLSEWVWGRKKFELHTYPQRCRLPHSRYVLLVWDFLDIWGEWPRPSPVLSPILAKILTNFGWDVWVGTCCNPAPWRLISYEAPVCSLKISLYFIVGVRLWIDWAALQ